MMASVEGDFIHEIKSAMILSDVVTSRFDRLFDDNDTLNCDNKREILKYVLERYANMQGTHFVKHLKGNSNRDVDKLVASQSTRTCVANGLVQSKVAGEVKKKGDSNEKQFWEDAADNVLKEHDIEAQNNSNV